MMQKIKSGLRTLCKILLIVLFNAVCLLFHAGIFFLFEDFPMTGDGIAIGILFGQIYVTKSIWRSTTLLTKKAVAT